MSAATFLVVLESRNDSRLVLAAERVTAACKGAEDFFVAGALVAAFGADDAAGDFASGAEFSAVGQNSQTATSANTHNTTEKATLRIS
jgi:hypothetical protein